MDKETDFNTLVDRVIEIQGHRTLFLSYSNGKDSMSAFLRCWETGKFDKFVLYYYYLIPEISWIEDHLQYFENKFGVKVIRVPNPHFYRMLHNGVLQTPLRLKAIEKWYSEGGGWIQYDHTDLMRVVRQTSGLSEKTLCGVGVRSQDSALRRTALQRYGLINEKIKKWYPVHDFSHKDIRAIIKKHDVEYPEDYDLFGLTFDGLDYRFLKVIEQKKPEDYQKIKEWFPMIDLVIHKREHYFGNHIRRSKFKHNI